MEITDKMKAAINAPLEEIMDYLISKPIMERKEAIESLRQLYFGANAQYKAALECLIPDLKESEYEKDERVRKALLNIVSLGNVHPSFFKEQCITWDEAIAYLQKPELCDMGRWDEESYNNGIHSVLQNPEAYGLTNQDAEWSEEDKQKLNRIYEILGYAADDKGFLTSKRIIGDKEAIELQDFLKSIRPVKQEWNEEDVEKLAKIRAGKSGTLKSEMTFYRQGVRDAFNYKGLHHSWKPSEEQMEQLERAMMLPEFGPTVTTRKQYPALESLYNDLLTLI